MLEIKNLHARVGDKGKWVVFRGLVDYKDPFAHTCGEAPLWLNGLPHVRNYPSG